jgi:hypothetical protein
MQSFISFSCCGASLKALQVLFKKPFYQGLSLFDDLENTFLQKNKNDVKNLSKNLK